MSPSDVLSLALELVFGAYSPPLALALGVLRSGSERSLPVFVAQINQSIFFESKRKPYKSPTQITHQVPEMEIVHHLNVSRLSKFLFLVHLPPNPIHGPHVQELLCIDFPRIAVKKHNQGSNKCSAR